MTWSGIDFQTNVVTFCLFFILFVISVKVITSLKGFIEQKETVFDDDETAFAGQCKYPDCVRCRRHKDVLMRARTRLTYCDSNHQLVEDGATVASQLLKDIQTSYQKLTQVVSAESPKSVDVTKQNPLVFHMKGIRAQPAWDTDEFPGVDALSASLKEIQKELKELLKSYSSKSETGYWKVNKTPSGKWGICHLVDQGVQTKAVGVCPATWQTISSLRAAMTDNIFGNVAFSVIEPGTTIKPHFGPSNIRIRCHLGLQVPAGCQLAVGGQTLQWAPGKVLCFDETFLHGVTTTTEAKPTTGDARAVLIVDLWHPDLDSEQRRLIDYAFSSATLS